MDQEIVLSNFRQHLLETLFVARAASAKQLAKLVYNKKFPTKSNEKFTYNELAKLRDLKLVEIFKPQPHISNYSFYYLSKKGLSYIQALLDIMEGTIGSGWNCDYDYYYPYEVSSLPLNHDYGYFPYEVYLPPLNQLSHHTMLIDFYINITVVDFNPIEFRNNLYSKRKTWSGHILRMDAEVKFKDKSIAIEIDRGTETHEQLIKKFEGYKRYLSDLETKGLSKDIHAITFIVENRKEKEGGIVRRWNNILSAYYKGMGKYAFEIDLHLTRLDRAYNLLNFQLRYQGVGNALIEKIKEMFNEVNYSVCYINSRNKTPFYFEDTEGYFSLLAISSKFSTSFINNVASVDLLRIKHSYLGLMDEEIFLNPDLSRYGVEKKVINLFEDARRIYDEAQPIFIPTDL